MNRSEQIINDLKNMNLKTLLLVLSVVFGIYLNTFEIDTIHSFIRFCPFVFIAFLVLFISNEILENIGFKIITILYFIKLSIMPIIEVQGNYFSIIPKSYVNPNWNKACILIMLEWFVFSQAIFLTNYLIRKKYIKVIHLNSNKFLYSFSLLSLFILIFGLIIDSSLVNEYFFPWMSDLTSTVNVSTFYYFYKWILERAKPIIFFTMVTFLYKKNSTGRSLLIFIISIFSAILFTEYRMMSIFTALTIIVWLIGKNKGFKISSSVYKFVLFIGVIFLVLSATMHNQNDQNIQNISRLFDIYLGGYAIAAGDLGINIPFPQGFISIFNSVWNQSTYISNIFGKFHPTNDDLLYSFLPAKSKGVFFEASVEGFKTINILYVVVFALIVILIYFMYEHYKSEVDDLYKLIYLFMTISTSTYLVMYTMSMEIAYIIYFDMFFYIILLINSKIQIRLK